MALIDMDACGVYYSTLADEWASFGTDGGQSVLAGTSGRWGGSCIQLTQSRGYARKQLTTNYGTLGFGIAVQQVTTAAGRTIIGLGDNGSGQIILVVNADGSVTVRRGGDWNTATTLATSAAGVFVGGGYVAVGLEAKIHSSTGYVKVWINSVLVINATGLNTQATGNAFANQLWLGDNSAFAITNTRRYQDAFWWDTTGAQMITYPGDRRVRTQIPAGAGAATQFTPSASTNASCVDDTTPNDDTDYVASSTVNQKDLYTVSPLPSTGLTVEGVSLVVRHRIDDATARTLALIQRSSGGTEAEAAAVPCAGSYTYAHYCRDTDPGTGARYTASGFNAMQVGQRVAS